PLPLLPQPVSRAAEAARVHRFPQDAPRVSIAAISTHGSRPLRVPATRRTSRSIDNSCPVSFRIDPLPGRGSPDAKSHDPINVAGRPARLLLPRLRRGTATGGVRFVRDLATRPPAAA